MKNGYCRSSSKKYAKMVLFGLKTHFKKIFLGYFYPPTLPMQKNWVKMVPKQVFIGAGKSPPPLSMSIPEAPYGRVKFIIHCYTGWYQVFDLRNHPVLPDLSDFTMKIGSKLKVSRMHIKLLILTDK